ncbi:hypothetical protein, partial [Burkholderia contaminans]
EVRPEYERNSPRMSSNSYVNLKIATCLVRYADDRLIDQRFPSGRWWLDEAMTEEGERPEEYRIDSR